MTERTEPEGSLSDTLENVARIVVSRRWYIICTTFVVALAGAGVAAYLPSRYTSEATLVVVQQRISQRYVDPATTGTAIDALNSITREILSRDRMLAIINEFGLYTGGKKHVPAELLVERVRKDTNIEPVDFDPRRDLNAFKVTFTANTPRLAQDVTSRLTSLLIESNLKARGGEVSTTSRFLDDRLAEAKQKLEQQEQRIRDFKVSNAGGMPEQEQYNLTTLADLRAQLQNSTSNSNRAQVQRINLESELNSVAARLASERTSLLARFTAKHPEVLKASERIAKLEALLSRLKIGSQGDNTSLAQPGSQGATPTSVSIADDPIITRLQGQVEAYLVETANLAKEQARLGTELARAQSRLKLTPVTEQQLASVLREYEIHKQNYTDLLSKQTRAQMSASVEEQQEGQHFRIADPPTLPIAPSEPKRLRISLGAVGGGLAMGIALALLVDFRDGSYHAEKALRQQFSIPIIVGVPLLRNHIEQRKYVQSKVLQWIGACVMVLCLIVAEFYVLSIS